MRIKAIFFLLVNTVPWVLSSNVKGEWKQFEKIKEDKLSRISTFQPTGDDPCLTCELEDAVERIGQIIGTLTQKVEELRRKIENGKILQKWQIQKSLKTSVKQPKISGRLAKSSKARIGLIDRPEVGRESQKISNMRAHSK